MPEPIHVLILEDRRDDAEIMVLELEADGYEVRWVRVETPEAFLDQLEFNPDIILADYTLPRFTAPDALALLQKTGRDIPFIVVTGSISEEAAVFCMKQGAADYLLKDRLSRLGEAVRHALRTQNLRLAQRAAERQLIVLGHAVDTSINAVVMTDIGGVITFINRAVLDLWSLDPDLSVIGTRLRDLLRAPAETERLLAHLTLQRSIKGELHSTARAGRKMVLQYAANQVIDPPGKLLNLMFTFIDVTEQKKAEELRAELQHERELRELKSRFVSMLVHDFRNPLTSLQMSLSLIEKYTETFSLDQIREKLSAAQRQSANINQLVDDVLMIGKIEHLSSIFSPEQVELVGFCRTLFEDVAASVSEQHNLRFETRIEEFRYPVDPALLRRALTNLLANAVKYSPAGGSITMTLSTEKNAFVLRVSDSGIGIPEADQKRIFDGFHRASNVGSIGGTGLGLAIVKQVIVTHGGYITCESKLNRGTTFTITLPLDS